MQTNEEQQWTDNIWISLSRSQNYAQRFETPNILVSRNKSQITIKICDFGQAGFMYPDTASHLSVARLQTIWLAIRQF